MIILDPTKMLFMLANKQNLYQTLFQKLWKIR